MQFLKQNTLAIGGGIVLLLAVGVYFMYFSGGGSSAPLTTTDEVSPVSKNILVTIQNLHTIKLDNTIFTDPSFVSLTDFGVTIPPQPVGRRNPFIPLFTATPSTPAK